MGDGQASQASHVIETFRNKRPSRPWMQSQGPAFTTSFFPYSFALTNWHLVFFFFLSLSLSLSPLLLSEPAGRRSSPTSLNLTGMTQSFEKLWAVSCRAVASVSSQGPRQ